MGDSFQNWKFFPESKTQSLSTPQISTTFNPKPKPKSPQSPIYKNPILKIK